MQTRVHPALSEMLRQFAGELRQEPARDAELLAAFAEQQDDEAFAALVARHGPVVWGVCSRSLNDPNDAEDAFQATFLALARQSEVLADRVQEHETLAGWLYLTAQRIAHNLRRARTRRCSHEQKAAVASSERVDKPVESVAELGAVLDEELGQLPARFRDPLILCYFQDKTHADAARQLGCPVGTVSGRLARGCELLRARLARRGVALAVGQVTVAVAMLGSTARAAVSAVPTGLATSTVAAARSFVASGAATTDVAQLALGVAPVKAGLKTKLAVLLVVAALGMTAAAGVMNQGPVPTAVPPTVRAETSPTARETNDAFGDPLPEGAVARLGTLRFRTGKLGQASSVAFGPGGKRLLSAHGGDVVHVWDPVTGREERALDAPRFCTAVSATPDGRRLVGVGGSEVWAWDLAADPPAVLWKVKPARFVGGNVHISPDGRLVAAGDQAKASVVLLDAATGDPVRTLTATGNGFAFSPDSKLLAIWHRKSATDAVTDVSVWSVADGAHKYTLEVAPKGGAVSAVAFSPDGKSIATVAGDRRLRLWDAANGKARADLATDAAQPAYVGFLPDGTLIEAGGGQVRFWDLVKERPSKPPIRVEDTADAYLLSADGTRLARAGLFGVGVREVATGREVGAGAGMPDGLIHSVTFAPDSKSAAMSVYSESTGGSLYLWDATAGKLRGRVGVGAGRIIGGVDFGADGAIAAACVSLYEKPTPPTRVVTWAADLGRERGSYTLPAGARCGAVSPDKRHVAVGTGDRVVLCDRATGKEVQTLPLKCQANSLAFSADGTHLGVLDSAAKQVTVYSLAGNRQTVWPPAGTKIDILLAPLALSPDGRLFAVNANEKGGARLRVVETATGAELWRPDARVSNLPVQEFAFAPDGRTFSAAGVDGTVRVWEVASGEERFRFPGHRAEVFSIAYSPDSRLLASTSYDSTALVWDVNRLPAPPKGRSTPDEIWAALTGREVAPAYSAIAALTAAPADAVPLLRSKLVPPAAPPERVRQWLADLGSDEFKAREDASRELALRGDLVLPDLKRALAETDSAETRARLERLLARTGARAPNSRGVVRGVEALERMATADPGARQLLRELAGTPAESLLGREARAAYRRLPPAPQK